MKHFVCIIFSLISLFVWVSGDDGYYAAANRAPVKNGAVTEGTAGVPPITGRRRFSARARRPPSAKNATGLISKSKEQCGWQADEKLCPYGQCCSNWGYCGTTSQYCDSSACQSQCSLVDEDDIINLIPEPLFDKILPHRNDEDCPAKGFYTYEAFVSASYKFQEFAAGDTNTSKREIAAFLAQTSHQTAGGWPDYPDGRYSWGYCKLEDLADPRVNYCVPNSKWPCVPGKSYHGRGPMLITYNDVYGKAGHDLLLDLLDNPDLVTEDPIVSFETAFWFWMTPQKPDQPSCHDVITGNWTPSPDDISDGRLPGYGLVTNIINGWLECGHGWDRQVEDRIGFYKKFCDMLGVDYGDNLDCGKQKPYSDPTSELLLQKI